MIRIEFEYSTHTPIGFAECHYDKGIYDAYRDIETVEEVVALVKKAFSDKRMHNVYVNFSIVSSVTGKKIDVSRIFYNYSNHYNVLIFEGKGAYTDLEIEKVDAKRIREMYLACANYALHTEAEEQREAV